MCHLHSSALNSYFPGILNELPKCPWTGWYNTQLSFRADGCQSRTLPKHSLAHAHCISRSLPRRGVCSDPTRNGASTEIHRTATRCVQQMEKNKMTTTEKHEKSAGLQSTSQRSWYTPPAASQPFQGGDTYYRITLHRI